MNVEQELRQMLLRRLQQRVTDLSASRPRPTLPIVPAKSLPSSAAYSMSPPQTSSGSQVFVSLVVLVIAVPLVMFSYRCNQDLQNAPEIAAQKRDAARAAQASDLASRIRIAVARREMLAGMTGQDVRQVWGEPNSISRTTTVGRVTEQWIYRQPSRYAYLTEGVLISWQETK